MSLWADKYRPKTLGDLDYHADISARLRAMASSGDFPHLLVYGPSGAGKKTRVLATLRELYGPSVEKLKVDIKVFTLPSGRKLEFNVISSPYHLEITPSDMGNNDRIVIQDLLKETAQVESIDFAGLVNAGAATGAGAGEPRGKLANKKKFKVVVINEAEQLSRDAQAALRRTMEKYSANIRLILICNSTSNIIDPIKSRTLPIRLAAPSVEECSVVFDKILQRENEAKRTFPDAESDKNAVFARICESADRNLRMAVMMMEALYMNNDTVNATTQIIVPDWAVVIKTMAGGIYKDRSVSKLQELRSVLYELLAHSIPAKLILKKLVFELWSIVGKDSDRMDITAAGAVYDERLSLGSKDIFHLEGFITRVMVILERGR